jgi:hypothetical protein
MFAAQIEMGFLTIEGGKTCPNIDTRLRECTAFSAACAPILRAFVERGIVAMQPDLIAATSLCHIERTVATLEQRFRRLIT